MQGMLKFVLKVLHALVVTVAVVMGLMVSVILLAVVTSRPKETSAPKACQANLKQIDSSTEQYLMDNKTPVYPALSALSPTYMKSAPVCPSGGTYTMGSATADPTCSIGGTPGSHNAHALP